MGRIAWNVAGSRTYEAGVDRGVLYVDALAGVPWVGLISVDEAPSGGEAKPYYLDGIKYLNVSNTEEFEATITAYTYPLEFSECDGTIRVRPGLFFGQQKRKPFGFSYRTMVGNDTAGIQHGYKIHLVYNALATPSSRSASTRGETTDATDFSWNLTTQSRLIDGYNSTAHVIIDSRYTHPTVLASIEDTLYGSDSKVSSLPTPEELIAIFDTPLEFTVFDNGDGSYLVEAPDDIVTDIGAGRFIIDHSSVEDIDGNTYTIVYS